MQVWGVRLRVAVAPLTAALVAAACGPDLAAVETEQQALEKEVEVLRSTVDTMRTEMQARGLLPSGPAGSLGPAVAGTDLSQDLQWSAKRTGTIPKLEAALGAPERRDTTECGYRFHLPWLEALSDASLESTGSGRASPILLLQDGKPLEPHANAPAYDKACKFAFRHMPKFLFFSPNAYVGEISGTWTVALDPEVPIARGGDARPTYWVYPGTTLTFTFDSGWQSAWGPMSVQVDTRLLYVGTPDNAAPMPGGPATVSVLDSEESGSEPRLGLEIVPEPPPESAWTVEITSPPEGPYVLVELLRVGNDNNALVVTAPGPAGE
jgi:hypothetical protein